MNVYKTKYLEADYYADTKYAEVAWQPATEMMTAEEYKTEFLGYYGLFKNHDIKRVLVSQKDLRFRVVPELQEWVNQNVFAHLPKLNLAIVLSEDIIAQLAAEQLMDEKESKAVFTTKFFGSKEDARKWILNL